MLHIAIVTNNYKPYKGGVVSSIESFTNELMQKGYKVSIITLDFDGKNELDQDYVHRIKCPIKFNYKTNPIGIPWRYDHYVFEKIKELKPDIIHSQHPFLLGVSALKASKKFKIPIIFTYHTRYEQYSHYIPLPEQITSIAIKKLALEYCKQVDQIIAPTESTKKFLIENNIKTPINVISSGISNVFLASKKTKLNENQFKLLFVSRFTKEKNIPFLLEVFSKLDSKFTMTLIGYGSETDFLKNLAYSKLKIETDRLNFIISPPKNIIAQQYQESDLFLFSSKTETQGIVLAEAMASGLPVIALEAPGSIDIIKNGQNGFLVKNKDEMLEKIKLVSQDLNLKSKLSENALKTGQFYSIESCTSRLIECYNSFTKNQI